MLIQNAELKLIRLPLLHPVRTPYGELAEFETLIFTLKSASGVGRAELPITLFPDADLTYFASVLEKEIIPAIENQSVSDTATIRKLLGKWSRNPTLYALVEMAWFDLQAVEKNQSLTQILGGETVSQQVFTSEDEPELTEAGVPDADAFLDRIKKRFQDGYVHLELKIRPGWDIAMVRTVRQENPSASFHLDFEGALGVANYDTIFQLRDFFPYMLEQPFAVTELVEDAELQQLVSCPVALDESVTSPGMVAAALRLGSARLIRINPLRCGGYENAREILAMCREAEIDCWISSPLSSGIAVRANLAFSCLDGFTGPFEYYDLTEYFSSESLAQLELPPTLMLDEENTLRIE